MVGLCPLGRPRRTPPGVRELKRDMQLLPTYIDVAPLPGCVN